MRGSTQWKKSSPEMVALFDEVAPGTPAVRKPMFGYPAAFVNGNLFMSLFQESLILRLSEEHCRKFLKIAGARPFEPMPGRPMRGFVAAPAELLAKRAELRRWITLAFDYGKSLKPKAPARRVKEQRQPRKKRPQR